MTSGADGRSYVFSGASGCIGAERRAAFGEHRGKIVGIIIGIGHGGMHRFVDRTVFDFVPPVRVNDFCGKSRAVHQKTPK